MDSRQIPMDCVRKETGTNSRHPPIIAQHTTNFAKPNHDSNFSKPNHDFLENVNCGINQARDLEFLGHTEICVQHLNIRVALNLEELQGTRDDASVGQQCVGGLGHLGLDWAQTIGEKEIHHEFLEWDLVSSMGWSSLGQDVVYVTAAPVLVDDAA
ncbi:hypothetical protein VNO78_10801 [Psophocarpus tetragonolobus]|uniref:Uncharacterized protein n=1 Tax=Psophocarpus tetragonolobus TaxID=3891 RepID=A0AAN9SL85_PSOTE